MTQTIVPVKLGTRVASEPPPHPNWIKAMFPAMSDPLDPNPDNPIIGKHEGAPLTAEQAAEAIAAGMERAHLFRMEKGYVPKEEQRTPLLSDEELIGLYSNPNKPMDTHNRDMGAAAVRDWYEAKRASGELMEVRTVSRSGFHPVSSTHSTHDECDGEHPYVFTGDLPETAFCPGCGAKIIP